MWTDRAATQVMVHKSQESLARDVLSEYPWFSQSSRDGGVRIKAVKEVCWISCAAGSLN